MGTDDEPEREPALIELRAASVDFELALRLVEQSDGRVLHAFPPYALIAELPRGSGDRLVGQAGITAVNTGDISVAREGQSDGRDAVIDAWNAHLAARRTPQRRGGGLAWDAPGVQPPDPPPEVKEQLRRRERGLRDDSDSSQGND